MLLQSINLDASMSVSEVLERLARYGLWIDPNHQAAKSRIADHANRLGLPFEEIAECLASKHNLFHAAIRRQWNANILWYARPIEFVLEQCASANPVDTLLSALGLHEKDSRPVIDLQTSEEMPNRDGIVLDGGVPVAVNVASGIERKPRMATGTVKWFNDKKGFGFISQDNGDDVFVHHTSIEGEGFRTLAEGDKVEFEVVKDQKGYKATKVAKFIARTSKVRRCIEKETSGTGGGSGGGHEMPSASSAPRGVIGATPKFNLGRELAGSDVTSEIGMVTNSDDSLLPVTEIRAWPRLDAPRYVPAQQPFGVVVGFGENQQAGVTGDKITFPVPADATFVDITVELIADGIDAMDGWSKPLRVSVENPTSAQVTFRLTGRNPTGTEPVHLTMLEVRYVLQGTICGTASRPLVIGQQTAVDPPTLGALGVPWLAQPVVVSAVNLKADELVPDLTIELVKTDRNAATGRYICRLYSPHDIVANMGPHDVDLSADAKSFAKEIVDDMRLYSGKPLIDNALISFGGLVAQKLPPAALDALREVAQKVAPKPPTVLIVSADPYVPWELAMIDPPLDASRPPYLGAQAIVGRWLREGGTSPDRVSVPLPSAAPVSIRMEKPPLQPPTHIDVRNMAVMGGFYGPNSGLRNLPKAEDEAKKLAQDCPAILLAASPAEVKQLLDDNFKPVGSMGAVHFAGHGDFNPTSPDSSVLFLNDGTPLKSILFRSAKYGGEHQPLIFLNACMVGIGGELLGNMGGFPGNCLSGGFGGMLGALWEVDDTVAHDFAIEFWQRALPTNGKNPEPIGAILRDLRAKYNANSNAPVTTYLAYVYYGHPRLTLHRIPL